MAAPGNFFNNIPSNPQVTIPSQYAAIDFSQNYSLLGNGGLATAQKNANLDIAPPDDNQNAAQNANLFATPGVSLLPDGVDLESLKAQLNEAQRVLHESEQHQGGGTFLTELDTNLPEPHASGSGVAALDSKTLRQQFDDIRGGSEKTLNDLQNLLSTAVSPQAGTGEQGSLDLHARPGSKNASRNASKNATKTNGLPSSSVTRGDELNTPSRNRTPKKKAAADRGNRSWEEDLENIEEHDLDRAIALLQGRTKTPKRQKPEFRESTLDHMAKLLGPKLMTVGKAKSSKKKPMREKSPKQKTADGPEKNVGSGAGKPLGNNKKASELKDPWGNLADAVVKKKPASPGVRQTNLKKGRKHLKALLGNKEDGSGETKQQELDRKEQELLAQLAALQQPPPLQPNIATDLASLQQQVLQQQQGFPTVQEQQRLLLQGLNTVPQRQLDPKQQALLGGLMAVPRSFGGGDVAAQALQQAQQMQQQQAAFSQIQQPQTTSQAFQQAIPQAFQQQQQAFQAPQIQVTETTDLRSNMSAAGTTNGIDTMALSIDPNAAPQAPAQQPVSPGADIAARIAALNGMSQAPKSTLSLEETMLQQVKNSNRKNSPRSPEKVQKSPRSPGIGLRSPRGIGRSPSKEPNNLWNAMRDKVVRQNYRAKQSKLLKRMFYDWKGSFYERKLEVAKEVVHTQNEEMRKTGDLFKKFAAGGMTEDEMRKTAEEHFKHTQNLENLSMVNTILGSLAGALSNEGDLENGVSGVNALHHSLSNYVGLGNGGNGGLGSANRTARSNASTNRTRHLHPNGNSVVGNSVANSRNHTDEENVHDDPGERHDPQQRSDPISGSKKPDPLSASLRSTRVKPGDIERLVKLITEVVRTNPQIAAGAGLIPSWLSQGPWQGGQQQQQSNLQPFYHNMLTNGHNTSGVAGRGRGNDEAQGITTNPDGSLLFDMNYSGTKLGQLPELKTPALPGVGHNPFHLAEHLNMATLADPSLSPMRKAADGRSAAERLMKGMSPPGMLNRQHDSSRGGNDDSKESKRKKRKKRRSSSSSSSSSSDASARSDRSAQSDRNGRGRGRKESKKKENTKPTNAFGFKGIKLQGGISYKDFSNRISSPNSNIPSGGLMNLRTGPDSPSLLKMDLLGENRQVGMFRIKSQFLPGIGGTNNQLAAQNQFAQVNQLKLPKIKRNSLEVPAATQNRRSEGSSDIESSADESDADRKKKKKKKRKKRKKERLLRQLMEDAPLEGSILNDSNSSMLTELLSKKTKKKRRKGSSDSDSSDDYLLKNLMKKKNKMEFIDTAKIHQKKNNDDTGDAIDFKRFSHLIGDGPVPPINIIPPGSTSTTLPPGISDPGDIMNGFNNSMKGRLYQDLHAHMMNDLESSIGNRIASLNNLNSSRNQWQGDELKKMAGIALSGANPGVSVGGRNSNADPGGRNSNATIAGNTAQQGGPPAGVISGPPTGGFLPTIPETADLNASSITVNMPQGLPRTGGPAASAGGGAIDRSAWLDQTGVASFFQDIKIS